MYADPYSVHRFKELLFVLGLHQAGCMPSGAATDEIEYDVCGYAHQVALGLLIERICKFYTCYTGWRWPAPRAAPGASAGIFWYQIARMSRYACSFQYSGHRRGVSTPPP